MKLQLGVQMFKRVPTLINDGLTDHTVGVSQRSFDHQSICSIWSLCHFLLQVLSASPGSLQQFLM